MLFHADVAEAGGGSGRKGEGILASSYVGLLFPPTSQQWLCPMEEYWFCFALRCLRSSFETIPADCKVPALPTMGEYRSAASSVTVAAARLRAAALTLMSRRGFNNSLSVAVPSIVASCISNFCATFNFVSVSLVHSRSSPK